VEFFGQEHVSIRHRKGASGKWTWLDNAAKRSMLVFIGVVS
jgi:hypothetical protein